MTMRSRISLLLAVLVVAAGVLTWKLATPDHSPAITPFVRADGSYRIGSLPAGDDKDAVAAAVKALPVALSYDYRSLDRSLAASTALMTPSFAAKYTTTFDATTRAMATAKQAITSALVRGAGIVGSAHDGRAIVLVYLDQVLVASKDKKSTDPLKVSQNRVHVTLRKSGKHWLVDDIEPF